MKFVEKKLPAHWASVLLYGDCSGLLESRNLTQYDDNYTEIERIDDITGGLYCVGVADDTEFTWGSYDCPGELAGDYCTYTFQILD